jgi:glutamate dehydrogenase
MGLTRPELAVLLAYGKLELKRAMVAGDAPDDPAFEAKLEGYFPAALRKWREPMRRHRLRRDIIATVLANDIIDKCGPSFPARVMAAADCDVDAFTAGYEAAKAVLDFDALWAAVAALDGQVSAQAQMALFRRMVSGLRGATFWLARRAGREGLEVADLTKRYGPGFRSLRKLLPDVLSPVDQAAVESRSAQLVAAGAPETEAREVALLQPLTIAADLVDLAEASSWPLSNVARLYHAVGAAFAFDRLRAAAGQFAAGDAFERTALRRLIEDLLAEQAQLTRALMTFTGNAQAGEDAEHVGEAIASWSDLRREQASAARRAIEEIELAGGPWTFAKLTIANAALRELVEAAGRKKRAA